MEPKLFKALEKKIDEFIKETPDEEIHFFFGQHTAEIMATAAAAVFDGMEHSTHCANRVGLAYDGQDEYESAADFIKAARKHETKERAEVVPSL